MPLEIYRRGATWWVRGRVEFEGRAVTRYYRRSTGASDEAGARRWIEAEAQRAVRRHLLGGAAEELTFAEAVLLYAAKPAEARFLLKIVPELGARPLSKITPREVRDLAARLYPAASTDTWRRQVATPVSAVVNNAHELGKGPPIRIRGWSQAERTAQDLRRGKAGRRERRAATREWIAAFVAAADPYNAALVEFMFETGARIGQAVALRPEDRDLAQGRVWLRASKGHPAQWVAISPEMVARLANLPPRRPLDRKRGERLAPRVFGYADKGGMRAAWETICARAGIERLTPHEAGRHGFYTELRVRQGVDPHAAARAGRWSSPAVPERVYAHSEADEREIRARFRTTLVRAEEAEEPNPLPRRA